MLGAMSQEVLFLLSPFMLLMIIFSITGWMRVPSDARFRGRLGPTGTDFTVGKGTGFAMRFVTALFVYFGAAVMGARGMTVGQSTLLGAVSLIVLLIGQISAIRRASG